MTQSSTDATQDLNFTPDTLGTFGGSDDGVISASSDALLETINLDSSNSASGGGFDFYENTTGSLTFGIVPKFTVGGGATTIGYDLSLPEFASSTDESITTDFNTAGWSQTSASLTSTGFDPAQDSVSLNLVFDANNVSASAGESNDYPFIPNVNLSTPTVNLDFDDEMIGISPGDLPKGAVGLTVEYPGTEGAVTANATLPDGAAVAVNAGSDDSISALSGSNTSDDNVLGLNVDLIAAMRAWAEDKVEEDPADTGAADLAADLSVIDGEIGSSGFNVHWALGTAILSGGIKLGEQVSFTPTSETVTYQTPYQTVTGALGQDFQLDNPAGIGSYTVNATYAITGTLTSVLQAVFNAGLTLEMLTAGLTIAGVSWDSDPLLEKTFDLASEPVDIYTKTQTVTLTYTKQYTVSYDDPNPTYKAAATPVSGEYFGHPGETIVLATTDPGNSVTLLSPAPTTGTWNYNASTGVISYTFGPTTTDDDLQALKFHIVHNGFVRTLDESLSVLDLPVEEPTFTPYSPANATSGIHSTYLDGAPTDEQLSTIAGYFKLVTDNEYDKFSVTLTDDSLLGANDGVSISTRTGSYAITGGVADDGIYVSYKPGDYNGSKAFKRENVNGEELYVADDTLTLTLQDLTTGLTYTGIKDKVTVEYSIPEVDSSSEPDVLGPNSSAAFGTVYPDYLSPANIYTIKMTGDALFGTSGKSALTIDSHGNVTYRAGAYSISNATATDLKNGYIDDEISYTVTNTLTGVSAQGTDYVRLDLTAPTAWINHPNDDAADVYLIPGGGQTQVMNVRSANGTDPLSITLLDDNLFTTKTGSTTSTSSSLFLEGEDVIYKAGPMPSIYQNSDDTTDSIKYKLTDTVTGLSTTGTFYVNITPGEVPVANIATVETYEKSVKDTFKFAVADNAANIIADLGNLNSDSFVSAIDVDDKVGYQATIAEAQTLVGSSKVAQFIVSDSAADVAAASPTLLGNSLIAAVELTGAANISEAAALAADSKVGAFSIADTKANVGAALADDSLAADATLTSITLTDATLKSKASWTLDAAEYVADAGVLAKIASLTVLATGSSAASTTPAYSLTVTGASVAEAAALQGDATVSSFGVRDSAADVQAALSVLNADTKLTSIAFTDATAPTLTIGYGTSADDSLALSKIASGATIVVEGASAAAAAKLQASNVTSFTVADTAADIAANSKTLNAASKLSSIAITTGALAADAAALQGTSKIVSFGVSDTAANVAKALDALNGDSKLKSIKLADTSVLTLTAAEALDDTRALTDITNRNYTIVIDDTAANIVAHLSALNANSRITAIAPNGDVSVAVAEQLQTLKSASNIQIRDTTTDIQAALGALNYNVVTDIAFSDASSPTLTLAYGQFTSTKLMNALKAGGAKLSINVSDAPVVGAAALSAAANVSAFTLADSPANVVQALATLAGYPKLAAIVLTGGGTPTLALNVAQATTYGATIAKIDNATYSIAISDTAAHVAAAFDALNALHNLGSITLTDKGTPTLTLTVAEALHDAAALAALGKAKFTLAISDTAANVFANASALGADALVSSIVLTSAATVAEASTLQGLAKLGGFKVNDNTNTVTTNLSSLAADTKLTALTLTDATTLTLDINTFNADQAMVQRLAHQTGFFVVTGANVAAAAALQGNAAVRAFTIADSSQTVMSQLATLAKDSKLTSVELTNATALTVGYSEFSANPRLFGLFALPGGLTVTGADAAQAADLQAQGSVTSFTVVDSADNVARAIKALSGYSKLHSVSLTGMGVQTLALSASAALAYRSLLGMISNAKLMVSDTAADVATHIDALNGDSQINSIELTDAGTPTLTLTVAQALDDTTALGEIANATAKIRISDTAADVAANAAALNADGRISSIVLTDAATAAEAAQLQSLTALSSFNVEDSPADIAADLTALNGDTKLAKILFPTKGPVTLTLTLMEAAEDMTALGKIGGGGYTIAYADTAADVFAAAQLLAVDQGIGTITLTTAATVAEAATLQGLSQVASFEVDDSAAAVSADIDALNGDTKLAQITLTDKGTPTLALTVAQALGDTHALDNIQSPYQIDIVDTDDNVAGALAALSANGSIASISIEGPSAPTFTLTVAQMLGDAHALGEIANPDFLIAISDTAADVGKNFDALNADSQVGSITLTDPGAPTLTLSVEQALDDTLALGKITNPNYQLDISDSAADVAAHIDALNAELTRIGSISLTDPGTPVLSITTAQAQDDALVLSHIVTGYTLKTT